MTINLSASRYHCVISPTNWSITNLNVACISLPHSNFYEHHFDMSQGCSQGYKPNTDPKTDPKEIYSKTEEV
jgi:hypothetical protein